MILRRGLRLVNSKCPHRLFSSYGNRRAESSQFPNFEDDPNSTDTSQDLHEDISWVRSQQNSKDGARISRTLDALAESNQAADRAEQLQALRTSDWKEGDLYAPHDLSMAETIKRQKPVMPKKDVFDVLGINPLHEYKNPSMMWEYMAPMGRIKHRKETGLRPVNQRRLAKAIRRAVGMGLIPSVHPHPEVLEAQAARRERLAMNYAEAKGSGMYE